MFGKEELSVLEKFGIDIRYYAVVNDAEKTMSIYACGGEEVIAKESTDVGIRDMLTKLGVGKYGIVKDTIGLMLPYRITDIEFDVRKLEKLLEHKSRDTYSKEEAIEIGFRDKDDLENDIVYLFDRKPVTNSLALAKQFKIKHKHVIEDLLKLGSIEPSALMQMGYKVYRDIVTVGGRPRKEPNVETVGTEIPAEHSAGILNTETRDIYNSYLEITEDVYYSFVQNMGKAKSIEMRIYRKSKRDEYFNAFQKMREFLYNSGVKKDELESMMKRRTESTSKLMSVVYDFVIRHNESNENQLNLINANRFMFNIINYLNDINAINYVPQTEEEYKLSGTRRTKDDVLQMQLKSIEDRLCSAFLMGKKYGATFSDVILTSLELSEKKVKSILKKYDVEFLYSVVS